MTSLLIKTFLLSTAFSWLSGLYNIEITTLDGENKSLKTLEGKKMMIVVLPVAKTAKDTLFLQNLEAFSKSVKDQLSVIGVPSIEDGFEKENTITLKKWYKSVLGDQVIITNGMHTRKASGSKQHPLFAWLTSKELNIHFDYEVNGPGQKYFINEKGELYAVYGPEVPVNGKSVRRMLQ